MVGGVKLKDKQRGIWGGSAVPKEVRWGGEYYIKVNIDM